MNKRDELINKYERNLNLVSEFIILFRSYLDKTTTWESFSFFDAKITNRQFFNELSRISAQEYSAEQHKAIKTIHIGESFLDGYINGIDAQYNNLSKLFEDLKIKAPK